MPTKVATVAAAFKQFQEIGPTFDDPSKLQLQLSSLLQQSFQDDPQYSTAMQILGRLFDPGVPAGHYPELAGLDNAFLKNSLDLKERYLAGRSAPSVTTNPHKSDRSEDSLASSINEWSALKALNMALMSCIPPRKTVAIVTSVRNEGLSILQWLAHHRAVGIEGFFVYTNNNTDSSGELLRTLAQAGVIHLIENDVAEGVQIQKKILEHSLHLLPELREFKWVLYIDVDEFFMSNCEPERTVSSFLRKLAQTFPEAPPSAICLNWKWFGSENAFAQTEGTLIERFVHSIPNEHVKSLVLLRDVLSMHRVHVPDLRDGALLVNSEFEPVAAHEKMQPTYKNGQINHYWNKSFQEFVLKRARGRISGGLSSKPLDFGSFFEWGANGRRGNLDPPDKEVLRRLHSEYCQLLKIPGVAGQLERVELASQEALDELSRTLDIVALYERRGQLL